MKYGSVCDGIGAAHVAWQPLGWQCKWTAEIDAFPSSVVEQRWGFPNRGDMTNFKEWNDGAIDLLVGGTPCQSFSVAGLRKGLRDPRGGLMLGFLEIAQRYRPRWVVWENVPGVLSSNGGRDFGSFVGALGELGYGWAYRVLDAQWFGVAQRRRRVFVVGCLGDERRAAQVLFESESVRRDNPPSRAKGEETTGPIAGCSNGGGANGPGRTADDADSLVTFHLTQDPISSEDGLVHAIGTGSSGGCATAAVAFDTTQITSKQNYSRPKAGDPCHPLSSSAHPPAVVCTPIDLQNVRCGGDVAGTLDTTRPSRGGGQAVCTPIDLRQASRGDKDTNNRSAGSGGPPGHGVGDAGDPAFTVSERGQAVAFKPSHYTRGKDGQPSEVTPPLSADADKGDQDTLVAFSPLQGGRTMPVTPECPTLEAGNGNKAPAVALAQNRFCEARRNAPIAGRTMAVRRLTPRECERLQGFPDDYTAITYRNKPAADGPRYKALGNSMAVPVMAWIGRRIALAEATA